jgi:hypothetical protein
MLYVSLPFGSDEDSEPEWGIDLSVLIDELIELYVCGDDYKIRDEDREMLKGCGMPSWPRPRNCRMRASRRFAEPAKLGPKLGPDVLI